MFINVIYFYNTNKKFLNSKLYLDSSQILIKESAIANKSFYLYILFK